MKPINTLPSWFALIAIGLLPSSLFAQQNAKSNVIVIVSDDQGWADIGYNNEKVYSPYLDELARTGAKLTNHYVMPQCTPTRVALLTGRYPSRFGGAAMAASNAPAFPKGTPTMSTMFKAQGYRTFLCGKWHLGSTFEHGPGHFGFDHSYGSLTGAVGMYNHRYRKGKFESTWHRNHKLIDGLENGTHATDLVANEAIRIIESDDDKPFFLYLPFHSVHTPLDERGKFVDRPTQLDPKQKDRWLNEDEIKWFNDPKGKIQAETDPEKRLLLAAVYHLDDAIGRIVAALEKSGKRKNTLILFSSDNGPQGSWNGNAYPDDLKLTDFNQPLPMKGKKLDVWEGGIHVPGIANWPGKIQPKEMSYPTHIIDWFPTMAKLIEFKPAQPVGWDGIDISPALFTEKPLPERVLYWNWSAVTNRWALRFADWKIVKYGKGAPKSASEWKLFHLMADPKEETNIAATNKTRVEALHKMFLEQRAKDKIRKPKKAIDEAPTKSG